MAKTDNQNAKLFNLGVAKSKKPNTAGKCRFPNEEIIPGMTNKKNHSQTMSSHSSIIIILQTITENIKT